MPGSLWWEVRHRQPAGELEAEAWVDEPPSSLFYLHRDFVIDRVWADGVEVPSHREAAAGSLPSVAVSSAVAVEAQGIRELHVKYRGRISGTIATVNQITSELVELALYAEWYPAFSGADPFNFTLVVDLPQEFVAVTNGLLTEQQLVQGRNQTTWDSVESGFDIVLLGSPRFQTMSATRMGTTIEMYYVETPAEELETKANDLLGGMSRLSDWYGPAQATGVLRSEYRQPAAQSTTQTSILGTEGSSADRYVKLYEKTALILVEARRRWGQEPLDGVLKALHARYGGTRQATTGLFLGEAEQQLGAEAKAFLSAALAQLRAPAPARAVDEQLLRHYLQRRRRPAAHDARSLGALRVAPLAVQLDGLGVVAGSCDGVG